MMASANINNGHIGIKKPRTANAGVMLRRLFSNRPLRKTDRFLGMTKVMQAIFYEHAQTQKSGSKDVKILLMLCHCKRYLKRSKVIISMYYDYKCKEQRAKKQV